MSIGQDSACRCRGSRPHEKVLKGPGGVATLISAQEERSDLFSLINFFILIKLQGSRIDSNNNVVSGRVALPRAVFRLAKKSRSINLIASNLKNTLRTVILHT